MKIKKANSLTYGILISIAATNTLSVVNAASNKIQIENPNYILQKYEPTEGTYLGTYILQDKRVIGNKYPLGETTEDHNSYIDLFENSVTSLNGMGNHASYFKYVGYKTGNLDNLYSWIDAVIENNAIPHIALEPNNTVLNGVKVNGLDLVKEDDYLINLAKKLGEYNTPIFLRYASEMNGSWSTGYHGDPKKYIEKWKIVHDTMEKYAPNVVMVWAPNDEPAELSDLYYPGDQYVDWVGINTYHPMYLNNNLNKPIKTLDQTSKIDYFYKKYAHKKPLFIGEYGTAHHTTVDGNKNNTSYAIKNLQDFYSKIKEEYPRIKAIYYFNVNTQEDGSIPEASRRIRNYSLTDEKYGSEFTKAYKDITSDNHFIKEVDDSIKNLSGQKDLELIELQKGYKEINGNKFISIGDLTTALNGSVSIQSGKVNLNVLGKSKTFNIDNNIIRNVDGYYYIKVATFCSEYDYKLEKSTNGYKLIKNSPSNSTSSQQTTSSQLGERVVSENTILYKEPNKTAIGTIDKKTIVNLNEIEGGWVKITTKDGKTGYIDRSKVKHLSTTKIGDRLVKVSTIIYASPRNGGGYIDQIEKGSRVELYSAEGNWAEVKTKNGKRGYINRAYLTMTN